MLLTGTRFRTVLGVDCAPRTVAIMPGAYRTLQNTPSPPRNVRCRAGPGNADRVREARLITAIKTPYLPNGKPDIRAYDSHLERQIQHGVEGVIVGGTTGEGQLMSWDEHIMMIAHTVSTFGDKVCVIGNTGSNATREALHATSQGFIVGMDAALQINPYYGKTSPEGLLAHFERCLDEGPAMIYNVPGRTGQDIPDVIIHKLSNDGAFLGVKECTGNDRIEAHSKKGIKCWSGNDDEAHDARHRHGGFGVVSVTSNLIPGLYSKMMKEQNDDLNSKLQELISWMFCQPNPIPVNTAMAMCGLCRPVFRLPYVQLSQDERQKGVKLLEAVQEHIPGCTSVHALDDSDFDQISTY
jgi:4-hydroxy-tetrahydrodipicolinate synthase